MDNLRTYERSDVVSYYVNHGDLQAPERTFLERYAPKLASMSMLDIGVGAGRTTQYFAPRVSRYVGIDYALPMVDACKRRFLNEPSWNFVWGDVRRLEFGDRSFDFVLFSYNGLDTVTHQDRMQGLSEIARVLKPGGLFLFSTHNLAAAPYIFQGHWKGSLARFARGMARVVYRAVLNLHYLVSRNGAYYRLVDGSHGHRLRNYYVRLDTMLQQLAQYGFSGAHIYSLVNGVELTSAELAHNDEAWLYYLCRKS